MNPMAVNAIQPADDKVHFFTGVLYASSMTAADNL